MPGTPTAREPDTLPGTSARPGEGEGRPQKGSSRSARRNRARPTGSAWDRALRLLAVRSRSSREIEDRLRRAGFEAADVDAVVVRLTEAGLLDDERFASELTDHAVNERLSGRRAVVSALRAKGIPPELAERALSAADVDEEDRAERLARDRARRLTGLERSLAARRLGDFLMRRGYDPSVARRAAARALELIDDEGP